MKIFVAGATGAIGQPLIRVLLQEGYQVLGITRSEDKADQLRRLGADAAIVDVLAAKDVAAVVAEYQPDVIIDQLTALPGAYTRETMRNAAPTDKQTRMEGGANLLAAAKQAGARRYILQSSAFFYAPGEGLADESTPFAFDGSPAVAGGSKTYYDLEQRLFAAEHVEGIVLRYGFFYGPGTWYHQTGSVADQVRNGEFPVVGDGSGVWSFVHVEDAARATAAAITAEETGAYNVVDDTPSAQSVWLPSYAKWLGAPPPARIPAARVGDADTIYYATQLRGASNHKAKRELNWQARPLEWLSE